MPQNHNRTMTLSKMAYSDNPEVASSYSFQIYELVTFTGGTNRFVVN
jgi:hypothetical protein